MTTSGKQVQRAGAFPGRLCLALALCWTAASGAAEPPKSEKGVAGAGSPKPCWVQAHTREQLFACAAGDPHAADVRLDELSNSMSAVLKPKQRARLASAQATWRKARDASCRLFAEVQSVCDDQGRNCAPMLDSMRTTCLIDETAARILFLKEFLRFP